mmetsp:Transcript_27401/g.60597  ORF Transcript_27401/g.60597 Transcript_27401/m.60597 type:complete len:322 (-) Transcript_27401:69-1034(-)
MPSPFCGCWRGAGCIVRKLGQRNLYASFGGAAFAGVLATSTWGFPTQCEDKAELSSRSAGFRFSLLARLCERVSPGAAAEDEILLAVRGTCGGAVVEHLVRSALAALTVAESPASDYEKVASYEVLVKAVRDLDRSFMTIPTEALQQTAMLAMTCRSVICTVFGWSLVCTDDLTAAGSVLLEHGITRLVDPAAGSGWHALLWSRLGFDVDARDAYKFPIQWTIIQRIPVARSSLATNASTALFLSWPPHSPDDVGLQALEAFSGSLLLYVGESSFDSAYEANGFHSALATDWEVIWHRDICHWPGFNDAMWIYKRRRKAAT